MDTIPEFVCRHRHVVVDYFFASSPVEDRAEVRRAIPELIRLRILGVGAKEHVLVHVRQAFIFRALCERAVLFYDATSADDLAGAVTAARELGIEYFVLGLGANILVGDKGFRGLVIRNTSSHLRFFDDGRLWVESGAVMAKLIPQAVERGLSGLEHYVGIPSTVGGAVWQNLHFLSPAPARERTMFIAEVFESAELLTHDGKRRTVDRDYMQFGYDTSTLHKQRDVALAVTFKLEPADP